MKSSFENIIKHVMVDRESSKRIFIERKKSIFFKLNRSPWSSSDYQLRSIDFKNGRVSGMGGAYHVHDRELPYSCKVSLKARIQCGKAGLLG